MTIRKYSSTSQETTLTSALSNSATTMVVASASGLLSGITPAAGETFTVVIDPDTALEEIVDVIYPSAPGSTTLTIVRGTGVDGTTAIAHSAGAKVRHMAIGRDFREANTHIENTTTAHGLTIANVLETTDTNMVTTAMLQANSVTTAKIADTNITTAKLADGAVTSAKIADLGIATGDIADAAITGAKILDGAVGTAKIDNAAVTEAKLGTSAVTTTKIADSNVTTAKIADLNVTTGKIADSAITSAKIADGTIVAGDIADGAITSAKILDATIATGDLADGAVTSAKIADGTIVNADVSATAAIAKTKLDLGGTITSADLADGTIVATDIADGTITQAKMAVNPYARANHTGTQISSTISDFDTQVRTSRLDQMAAPTASVALNSQKITGLADPVSTQDAVTLNYLNNQKGALNGIASLDGSGKIPTGQLPSIAVSDTFVVADQAAMLALSADVGDIAVRTDVNKSFILKTAGASTLANWQELLTPTDSVLSVDGNTGAVNLSGIYVNHSGDTMTGDLILNADPTVALGAATKQYVDVVAGSASAAAASAAAAATTYDNFDDRYLGAKATAPTLDNDGNALITGALYWNSTSNTMFAWSGSAWGSISSTAAIFRYRFTATAGQTSVSGVDANGFTLSYLVGYEQVYLNGVLLVRTSDYTASTGTSITSLAALAAGDIIEIITFTAFDLTTAVANTAFTAKGAILTGTGAGTYAAQAVGSDGTVLTANSAQADGVEWAAPVDSTKVSKSGGDTITVASGTTVPLTIQNNGTGNSFVVNDVASDASPFTIDAAGSVFVGSVNTSSGIAKTDESLQVTSETATGLQILAKKSVTGTNPANIAMAKSRGTAASPTAVTTADSIGNLLWYAYDGTNYLAAAIISGIIDSAVSTNNTPVALTFQTNGFERMRIDSAGKVGIGIAPVTNLDVVGTTYIRGAATAGTILVISADATSGANGAVIESSFNTGGYGPLIFKTGGSEKARIAADGAFQAPLIQNAQTTGYTTVLGDAGKLIEMNVSGAHNLTVPLNSSVAYPIGTQINILQTGAGQTTVAATAGVTINATPGLKLRAQWSSATLIKRATDTWVLVGDLSA